MWEFRLLNVILEFSEAGNRNLDCDHFQTTVKNRFEDCLKVKLVYAFHREPVLQIFVAI